MKLTSKKTGEIMEFDAVLVAKDVKGNEAAHLEYNSIDKFLEEWEDYEEPKVAYWIDGQGGVCCFSDTKADDWSKEKTIGNYFETREEAGKAVEKLKAWQRLKDKGFRFTAWKNGVLLDETVAGQVRYELPIDNKDDIEKDLDLLFSEEVKNEI